MTATRAALCDRLVTLVAYHTSSSSRQSVAEYTLIDRLARETNRPAVEVERAVTEAVDTGRLVKEHGRYRLPE
ncbi:hypothetical protein [Halomarina pelagica]|uniref:hypothetical protein n=1 Tax=Halomarina pelagica TaxID=2961599 RepID=UPI0020C33DFB|nr:hypothetical protein [Halomarina sp. BND7]